MIACVDVAYTPSGAWAACVVASSWGSSTAQSEYRVRVPGVEPYIPGEFYRRELPCLLRVLEEVSDPLEMVLVDGYVWLSAAGRPGLGERLHEALERRCSVVGVAKSIYFRGPNVAEVLRGGSSRPLCVTAVGLPLDRAVAGVRTMHGEHRIPALLKRVDELSRYGWTSSETRRCLDKCQGD